VLFSPTDLDLVIGSPLERRRFMDVTLCQVDSAYCRALSQYQKVATQRAALLRRIRDGEDTARALTYWDEQLAHDAAPVVRTRAAFLAKLQPAVARHYARLTADAGEGDEPLRLAYAPSYDGPIEGDDATVAAAFRERLDAVRRRELAQGVNVLGPHRDDLAFFAGPLNLATYGSRGQQRTVALALKLGELEFIEGETHEQPVLLLDDVLSELDASRRQALLHAVAPLEQVLLTVADATSVPTEALATAHVYTVRAATLEPQS
jgi:DNA replication and repair protein RecF